MSADFPAAAFRVVKRLGLFAALTTMLLGRLVYGAQGNVNAPVPPTDSTFAIAEYRVRGNSVLGNREIERALLPHLGRSRTIADVDAARAALERVYHERGYLTVYVDVPPQKVLEGVVVLRVTQATVRRTRVTGSTYHSLDGIRQSFPSLREGEVPDFNAVQRDIATANAFPDLRVTPVLKPSPIPGQVDVELKAKDQLPLHGSVEISNRQSLYTTATRLTGQLRYDNLWQRHHSLALFYEIAPERHSDADVKSLSYAMPLDDGSRLAFYAVRSRSNVATVGAITVLGQGEVYGARWSRPLPAADGQSRNLAFGVDYKNFNRAVDLQGLRAGEVPIRYAPLLLEFSGVRTGADATVGADAGLNVILRGLASSPGQFDAARANADTSYVILKGGVQRLQTLPKPWSVYARLDGQWASGALISNEQFVAGGSASVRGYREFEVIGDRGVRGSVELRLQSFGNGKDADPNNYVFAFIDGAHLDVVAPLPAQQARLSIASAGLGLRWRRERVSLDLDGAQALVDAARSPVPGNTQAGDHRIHVRVSYAF